MKIHLATDHTGLQHKEDLKVYLISEGIEVVDYGAKTLDNLDDYPDFVTPCALAVAADPNSFGIVFGGSGQGEGMCANRIKGIRAAVYYGNSNDILVFSREHNNANILSIGARFVSSNESIDAVKLWLRTEFSQGERHIRRLAKF